MDCLFCKIASGDLDAKIIYEDEHVVSFLDIMPISKGHALVVPKEHATNIFDMSQESYIYTHKVVHKLSFVIKEAVGACGVNIGMNNNSCAGQVIMHPHIHIIPRFENDSLELWKGDKISDDQMCDIFKRIKDKLN